MDRGRRPARLLVAGGLVIAAAASGPCARAAAAGVSLPRQVYAPYFETWGTGGVAATAAASGARYFTMAFIQTAYRGSCTPLWDGDPLQPVSAASFGSDISKLRKTGGDVIVSFGGSAADSAGTDIADSCTSVSRIAAAYEHVISTYGVTRLDMDTEERSLTNLAGISRRNQALKQTETWAAGHGISLQVQYTFPVAKSGLTRECLVVLYNAIAAGARVDVVNVMAFDYYDPYEGTVDMGAAAVGALTILHAQLMQLYRPVTSADAWRMEGVTLLPGIDSAPGKKEITYLSDASKVLGFARANHLDLISIWAAQRDNGNCPGVADSDWCSGLKQSPWAFTHLLNAFTG